MVDIATQVDALNRPLDELPNIVAKRQASEEALSKLSRLVEQNPGYKAQLVDFEDEKHGEKGLIPQPKGVSADPELRIKVVKAVIEQHMSLNQAAAHFMLAGSGSVARWLKVYEERGEAGLRALKIGIKRNIAISVDPEKAASALELSKDRRIEDLERQVRFLETRLMYLKKLKALAHPTKK